MADFPYLQNATLIKKFFEHIQTAGVPGKVNTTYLAQVGFKSSNDRNIIAVLKTLEFLSGDQAPSEYWIAYRNRAQSSRVMAGVLRNTYVDLFRTYPDAHRKDNEALRNYFSAHTRVAESTLGLIVSTFRALAALADFEDQAPIQVGEDKPDSGPSKLLKQKPPEAPARAGPAININIQLQLPATDDGKIYDSLFAAMKKHLFP